MLARGHLLSQATKILPVLFHRLVFTSVMQINHGVHTTKLLISCNYFLFLISLNIFKNLDQLILADSKQYFVK